MNKDDYEIKVYAEVNADKADYPDLPDELSYLKELYTPAQLTSTILTQAYMVRDGDVSERLRRVRHFAYFTSKKAAHRLAKFVHQQGYIETLAMPVKNKRWRVDFCSGTLPNIAHWVGVVRKIVIDAGGEYDGWESPVMRKDDPDDVNIAKNFHGAA
ncbi:ribonuclease E inhibitor RraB [Paraburkholderia sp. Ac-20336]|uniref:ribonuclease E inhibitor RraB n=1 Tax=Paraburkholderia sp. Ac-20336 TaxID=2703886 RepID=UPI001981443C|nr:ribonuclease E inhibitor RraB [Paraburkholderia sp. Ac-20336]MBN3804956.1 ribonuclease E inhibitor RraB [Paraburkholderia sp. Ac-20336]